VSHVDHQAGIRSGTVQGEYPEWQSIAHSEREKIALGAVTTRPAKAKAAHSSWNGVGDHRDDQLRPAAATR